MLSATDIGELQDSAQYLMVTASRLEARFDAENREPRAERTPGKAREWWGDDWAAENSPQGLMGDLLHLSNESSNAPSNINERAEKSVMTLCEMITG